MRPEGLVTKAKEGGWKSVVLTDTMTISALPSFMSAASKEGVKGIVGARLRIVDKLWENDAERKIYKPYHLRFIALTEKGMKTLMLMLSKSFEGANFFKVPKLLLSDVVEFASGLSEEDAVITFGDTYSAISANRSDDVLKALKGVGPRLAVDVLPISTAHFVRQNKIALDLANENDLMILMSSLPLYDDTEKADSLDLMGAISLNVSVSPLSSRNYHRDWTVKTEKETFALFVQMIADIERRYPGHFDIEASKEMAKNAFQSSRLLSDLATYTWEKMQPSLPKMADDEFVALKNACSEGWKKRLGTEVFGYKPDDLKVYRDRLVFELGILHRLKFEAYFLLVAEIVNWSKSNGITVGPGRGSVGGSLVAYLMGITDVDPIRFGLLFERFINPDRLDLPDADLDFMSTRRDEVIAHIVEQYGSENVAGVSNYTRIAGAGALSDVSKKMGVPNVPAFGSWIEKEHGINKTLDESMLTSPQLAKFAADHPAEMRHARIIEGTMRSYGQHAAGIIVAGEPIKNRAVVEKRSGSMVTNWDKRASEDFGLIKLDILGLSTLDVIKIATEQVFRNRGIKLDMYAIPLDDPKVLAEFGKGNTVGVFQFGGSAMRGLLRSLATVNPLTFDDLTAATSLNRPGPLESGLLEQFVKVKQEEVMPSYLHPSMKPALEETFGVFTYQEQVMRVAQDFAGFTGAEADTLRKAMGKKDKILMAKLRDKFVDGAERLHKADRTFSGEVYDLIEKFAGYGFNKSHATAYSMISYQSMYLKTYYPAEFFCGLLTLEAADKRDPILKDMTAKGIRLEMPDINDSGTTFEALHDKAIICPFSSINGISDKTASVIVDVRKKMGKFESMLDFKEKIANSKMNSKCNVGHIDKMDRVGAFSRIESDQEASDHHSRRKDQVELMKGLIVDTVVIDRETAFDAKSLTLLAETIEDYKKCDLCERKGLCHPKPWIKAPPKFAIVIDNPSVKEEGADEMGYGKGSDALEEALSNHGMSLNDVYLTSLLKTSKPKDGFSKTTISECPKWVDKELGILKPPLVLIMGAEGLRHFLPKISGTISDNEGRVEYDPVRDCNFLIGMNPNRVIFDDSKQANLNNIIEKAISIIE